jgi:hypothetical protein
MIVEVTKEPEAVVISKLFDLLMAMVHEKLNSSRFFHTSKVELVDKYRNSNVYFRLHAHIVSADDYSRYLVWPTIGLPKDTHIVSTAVLENLSTDIVVLGRMYDLPPIKLPNIKKYRSLIARKLDTNIGKD